MSKLFLVALLLPAALAGSLSKAGAAEAAPKQNIVQIAAGSSSFSTLVAAVKAANLVATLESPGPFTVFAPTDAAFAKLPQGTVPALLKDIPALTKILTYHVLPGAQSVAQLVKEMDVRTVQGEIVKVRLSSRGDLFVNDARVIAKPIEASNGLIYVIDTVLLPN